MGQGTLYLDSETEAKLKGAAKAAGVSPRSRSLRAHGQTCRRRRSCAPGSPRACLGNPSDVRPRH